MPVFFNGRLITTPAVASKIDDSAMANKNLTVPMNLAIIGQSTGGAPHVAHAISNPVDARILLKGGELLKAIEKAFDPSAMTLSPQTIYAVRVDLATQSRFVVAQTGAAETGVLQAVGVDGDAVYDVKLAAACTGNADDFYNGYRILMTTGAALGETQLITDFINSTKIAKGRYKWKNAPSVGDSYAIVPAAFCFESDDYGLEANRIKVKIETATTSGKKVTIAYGSDSVYEDNLAATYLTVQYTGAAASGKISVSGSQIIVSAGVLGSEVAILTCDLATYDTVSKVKDFLDAHPDITAVYTAKYKDYPVVTKLDYTATAQACKATAYAVSANLQAIVDWINGTAEPYCTAHRPTEMGVIPANVSDTFLQGGNSTTPLTANWQTCFDLLQSEDVQCIVPLTSTAAIHAMADTHCAYMSVTGGKERRAIVGGAADETNDQIVARAAALNSDRIYLVGPGFKDYNDSAVLTSYAPYMLAALVGGMICGSDPGTSPTNKTVKVRGVERKLKIPAETDVLIKGGVILLAHTEDGFKIIRSISTWVSNGNYNRVEMGTGFAVDYVSRVVRNALAPLIGRKGTPTILAEAVSRTENALKELARPAPIGPEVITGDTTNPAYKNITAELAGDVLKVYFECSPVVPINYVTVSISIVPYSGTASSGVY